MRTFEELESGVRSYCRLFPAVFDTARGSRLTDVDGKSYLDFFCGAGALNYGHHDEGMRRALIAYLERDAVVHGLDLATTARRDFLERFHRVILAPRGLERRIQFPGPTGANAIEAALKTARRATGRRNAIAFTNGFHGMTLGALALTSNEHFRGGAGVPLRNASLTPFERSTEGEVDSLVELEALLESTRDRSEAPAAVVLETIQAEGGVHVASDGWLREVARLAREHGALLIVDDIQVGCGRTGTFFSFESAGIDPDLICLSKSLSGYGLPLSVVLIKPELDVLRPGEHSGTFRANNLALVTAAQALGYWESGELGAAIAARAATVRASLERMADRESVRIRGRGLIWGVDLGSGAVAERARREAFERGLLIETVGAEGAVLKLLPPLVIGEEDLALGLEILEASVDSALAEEVGRSVK